MSEIIVQLEKVNIYQSGNLILQARIDSPDTAVYPV